MGDLIGDHRAQEELIFRIRKNAALRCAQPRVVEDDPDENVRVEQQ
jgi:hypothetical protein